MSEENNGEGLGLPQEETLVGQENKGNTIPQALNFSQNQLQWTNKQVAALERELLLGNNKINELTNVDTNLISNWTKVFLSALAVLVPGLGQIAGIIIGIVLISNDYNTDKKTFGAALLTVSLIAFIISAIFWYIILLAFGQQLY